MISSNEKELQINDFENNKIYKIYVNNEDYDRALSDHQFANSLLIHARRTEEEALSKYDEQPSTSGIKKKSNNDSLPTSEIFSDFEDSISENIQPNSQNTNKSTNVWSYSQTTHLINSMATNYTDFNDPRKRKYIFEHVANDLISAGFSVDAKICQNKWKCLLRSYTKAKDTKNRTGQRPSRFLFYETIDEIVGNQPKNSCHHSLNSLDTTVADSGIEEPNVELTEINNKNQGEMGEQLTAVESVGSEEKTSSEKPINNSSKKRKRCSEKQLKKEYIDLKREESIRRQKRHEEKLG